MSAVVRTLDPEDAYQVFLAKKGQEVGLAAVLSVSNDVVIVRGAINEFLELLAQVLDCRSG
jgi:hypothetical protein